MRLNLFPMESTLKLKKVLLLFLTLTGVAFSLAQKARISIHNPTYKNEKLPVLKEKDFITKQRDTIAFISFDKEGEASTEITCNEPFFVIFPLYKNQAWLCVEPNKHYRIRIPNKQHLSIEDSLNAYFEPIQYYAIPEPYDSSLTQQAIINLNYTIDTLLEKHLKYIRYKIKRKYVDSLLSIVHREHQYCNTSFFKDYLFFRLAWLKYLSYERNQNFAIKTYFSEKPVLLNNPAYVEFFNELFADYLSYYATTALGEHVFSSIAKAKSPSELRRDLKRNTAFINDTLIDLVIIKGLHDAYYSKNLPNKIVFPLPQLIMTLDSMTMVAKTTALRQIAKNVIQKLKEEEKQYFFEDYPLYDLEGNEYYLRNFYGKYLYVCIMDFRSYNFLTEQKKIKAIFSRFADKLTVITIVLYPLKEKLQLLIDEEKLYGNFFSIKNPELFKKQLKIRGLPSCMLYSPSGKLLDGQAPPPEESLIPFFIDKLK